MQHHTWAKYFGGVMYIERCKVEDDVIAINSLDQTRQLAFVEAKRAKSGDALLLLGEPGSGKSTFVRYFLQYFALEYQGSPTFGYLNYYENPNIVHVDLYNVGKSILEELVEQSSAIFLIEWANRENKLQKFFANAKILHFHFKETDRCVRVELC